MGAVRALALVVEEVVVGDEGGAEGLEERLDRLCDLVLVGVLVAGAAVANEVLDRGPAGPRAAGVRRLQKRIKKTTIPMSANHDGERGAMPSYDRRIFMARDRSMLSKATWEDVVWDDIVPPETRIQMRSSAVLARYFSPENEETYKEMAMRMELECKALRDRCNPKITGPIKVIERMYIGGQPIYKLNHALGFRIVKKDLAPGRRAPPSGA